MHQKCITESIYCLIVKQSYRWDENEETADGNQEQDDNEEEEDENRVIVLGLVIVLDLKM